MNDFTLNLLIKVAVTLAFVLLLASWRFYRSRSSRAKRWLIGTIAALVLLTVTYGFGRSVMRKRYHPRGPEDVAALTGLIEREQERIERVAGILETLRALVSRADWLPPGEGFGGRPTEDAPVYFAFQLRGSEHPEFGAPLTDLSYLEDLVGWAENPETIIESWWEPSAERLEQAVVDADAPLAIVVELTVVVAPEMSNVEFGADGSISGDFAPGRTEFRVAVVDSASGRIVAHGGGEATNGPAVEITADPDFLAGDLRARTRRAAVEMANQLLRADR